MGRRTERPVPFLLLILLLCVTSVYARFGDRLGPRLTRPITQPPKEKYTVIKPNDKGMYDASHGNETVEYEFIPATDHAKDDTHSPDHEDLQNIGDEHPETKHAGLTEAHRLEMSTEFFVVPAKPPTLVTAFKTAVNSTPPMEEEETVATVINATAPPPTGGLRREPWALPLLTLSCIVMLMMAAFEVYVLCKVWRASPNRRHLFLGQMLLLGLFSCAAQGALLAAAPSPMTCAAVRFGAGVSLALVFSALLVKCVFLISLNGGVYLPAPYQALLLFFAVMIQVVIGAQWLGGVPPRVFSVSPTLYLCRTPFGDLMLSFVYVAFLAGFVGVLAVKSRGIRDNYKEAGYIAWAAGGAAVLACCWAGGALLASPRHKDGWLGGGLSMTAAAVFLIMFAPKGRQLAALGKGGSGDCDREERLSSLSRAGSGYSPSFFHFKPVKYGVVNSCPAPQPIPAAPVTRKQPAPAPPADRYPPALARLYCYPGMPPLHPYAPPCHYFYPPPPPRFTSGLLMRSDDGNMYTTLEPTFSSNPNVYFQRNDSGVHPGMMY